MTHRLNDITRLNGLKMGHLNVCSLRNKKDQIIQLLLDSDLDIIGLSETNLDETCPSAAYDITGYTFLRQDRRDHSVRMSGGGLALYIRNGLIFESLDNLSVNDQHLEMQCTKIKLPNVRPILIFNTYRPPHGNVRSCILSIQHVLNDTFHYNNPEIYMMGDYNIDFKRTTSPEYRALKNLCYAYFFTQLIDLPTRITDTSATMIDLLFTNRTDIVQASGVVSLGLSDHDLIFCQRKHKRVKNLANYIKIRKYKNFVPENFLSDLRDINWEILLTNNDPEDCWAIFKDKFIPVCDRHAPIGSMKVRGRYPPWVNDEYLAVCKARDEAKDALRGNHTPLRSHIHKRLRNQATTLGNLLKRTYITDSIAQNRGNMKKL